MKTKRNVIKAIYSVLTFVLAAVMCSCFITSCGLFMSDEQLINKRIDDFIEAYNSGDMDEILECMDSKTRNTFKSVMGISESLLNVKPSDLFGLSVGLMSDGDMLTVSGRNINITGDSTATVDVTAGFHSKLNYADSTDEAHFSMVKEDSDWFIADFRSK